MRQLLVVLDDVHLHALLLVLVLRVLPTWLVVRNFPQPPTLSGQSDCPPSTLHHQMAKLQSTHLDWAQYHVVVPGVVDRDVESRKNDYIV